MNDSYRILATDTTQDAIVKLSDGNPGALTVMVELVKRGEGGLADIVALDLLGLYGSAIWIAFKDVCGQDIDLLSERLGKLDTTLTAETRAVAA